MADVAEASGLVAAFDEAAGGGRVRRSAHTPGWVLVDVAVMLAEGGEAIADLAGQRNQPGLFGQVASPATCWRVLNSVDPATLEKVKAGAGGGAGTGVAAAGRGRPLPAVVCAGRTQPGLVVDIDATLVTCHSEKEQAAPTYKFSGESWLST